ncbi:hypothetical protein [Acinetobacter calcoaceticus]|uniref:Uncharacterized protein n=1 Tax=Acinetobacter calcoaceticus DSM 30006 = CIP 81.8 TaxID=981331 RepID=A0ABN0KCI6_ACICA|nr:hypothetical protein [Acinetobacter calcoaceticus]ENW02012.1 hypothetical protein F936_00372 [Acinetobacter calcoaceticus DSM 30006 = CIP 81.8]SUU66382.1 Uncharacterised protein [Acinetobacter calcoaceticus]
MKKTIKFQDGSMQEFNLNREGFIQAVSYKESSADLKLSSNHKINMMAAKKSSPGGYTGFFQMGESALFETGYYLGDTGVDFRKLNPEKEKQKIKTIRSTFDKNDWKGKWSGKNGIYSFNDFLTKPELQLMAVSDWINYLCKRMQLLNFNQYYGQIINGVEVTESGAIASAHLMGEGGLATFLGSPIFKIKSPVSDGNGTHISSYLSMFGDFDLENCCKRKIYISLKDSSGLEIKNKEVIIISENNGKYISGETRVKVKSDENGNLPVIVRNPNTEIKIFADGKESNTIIQKANEKQKAILSDFKVSSHPATLEKNSTPQPKPQTNKTPQEIRNEQTQPSTAPEKEKDSLSKDADFNIQIVEGDSGKAISNMNFFLTYKGNIKKHTADSHGIKQNIIAEIGQDIEVSVQGTGHKQVIHHFTVNAALKNKTVKVSLPVHSFNISVTQENKPVPNTLFSIFYRGREISKRTDSRGILNVRMLTGFVFGFGIKGKSLILSRVEKNTVTKAFTVNGSAVHASKAYEANDAKQKQTENLNKHKKEKKEETAKKQADQAKTQKNSKNEVKQSNTYTENGGKPLTTVSNQASVTSDTTNYIIYPNGTIDRINKDATGFAAYYYVVNNQPILIGKSRIYTADRWLKKGKKGSGISHLVSIREIFGDSDSKSNNKWEKKIGNLNISIHNDTQQQHRYWLSTVAFAAYIGAVCKFGEKVRFSGFSDRNGSPGGSSSHLNGEVDDIGYIRVDRNHSVGVNFEMAEYDHDASLRFVNILISFGWGKTKNMLSEYYPAHLVNKYKLKQGYILPRCSQWTNPRHNNHLHLQGLSVTFNKDE